ncbi:MAG: M20/M25/M40 family metallo-hydrolase [Clostridium sp.]
MKLVFQPAEENGGGGREMIKAGLMDEIPDACFALHVENGGPGKDSRWKPLLSTAYSGQL